MSPKNARAFERLRLRAVDAEDLSVIAAVLQDALIPLAEMAYLADERRFMGAFTRFRRECLADPEQCDGLTQCCCVVAFDQVDAVKFRGLDRRLGRVRLELLTILAEAGVDRVARITLLFAGDAAIQLHARAIDARLDDYGEPWPAPVAPVHAPLLVEGA